MPWLEHAVRSNVLGNVEVFLAIEMTPIFS